MPFALGQLVTPIVVRPVPMFMLQFLASVVSYTKRKALSPISITLFGIIILERSVNSNADSPILVIPFEIVILFSGVL